MTSRLNAFKRGVARGIEISTTPDLSKRLRHNREAIRKRNTVEQAWILTGNSLRQAMSDYRKMS